MISTRPSTEVSPARIGAAIDAAVDFLRRRQLPNGEFEILSCCDEPLTIEYAPDRCVFPTALAAYSLAFWPPAEAIVAGTRRFLMAERDAHGLWKHCAGDPRGYAILPPDVDDTCCALAVLPEAPVRPARQLVLANRNRAGLFYTWFAPRFRWTGVPHLSVTLPQLRHLRTLDTLFRRAACRRGDIDAVVNANVLFYLGDFPGRETVTEYLLEILRHGREDQCDKYYAYPFVTWYFFSRALSDLPEATGIMIERLEASAPANPFDRALSICALLNCGRAASPETIVQLVDAQLQDGSWPRATFYCGGRRGKPGTFGPLSPPFWGSEELTTAFCIEALSRSLAERA
jgi:hypothetical protein